MSKSAVPVSKAKTAYGLLSEIRKLILEEPKRYDQGNWIRVGEAAKSYYGDRAPSCGTVGCVAGWVSVLKGGPTEAQFWDEVECFAAELLFGEEMSPLEPKLFDGDAAGLRNDGDEERHAIRGAEHIAKFQKKYAKQLKAKRV